MDEEKESVRTHMHFETERLNITDFPMDRAEDRQIKTEKKVLDSPTVAGIRI